MAHLSRTDAGGLGWRGRRGAGLVVLFVVAVVLQRLLYSFVQSKGVIIGGDEPSYVMQAQAHLSPHIVPTIKHDLAANVFPHVYRPHATVKAVETYLGPTGIVSPFAPGLGALLLVFVAVLGPVSGAILGMICLNTAGFLWLHRRMSAVARLNHVAQVVLAAVFLGPAILLAGNQIYPDLPAGILVTIGLLEIAVMEIERQVTRTSLVLVTVSAAAVPWLQPKNLVPAAAILLAFLFISWRLGSPRSAAVVIGVSGLSILLFLVYNHHYYGHWLGFPEPRPQLTKTGVQYTLGLLFDRDQGLFVQVPYSLLGLAGLVAFGWRRLPAAVVATAVSFLAILVLNGTYTANPYGGGSLAGRFTWSLIPISLLGLGLVISRFQERPRALAISGAVVAGLWVYQAVPVLTGHHDYYNPMVIGYQPWPTWWPGLIRVLPQFGRNRVFLGYPAWTLPAELAFAVVVVGAMLYWLRVPLGPRRPARS